MAQRPSNPIIELDDEPSDSILTPVVVSNTIESIDLCSLPSTSSAAAESASSSSLSSPSTASSTTLTATTTIQKRTHAEASAPLECPICLQICVHPAKLPCGHIFCFLCVKGVAYKNRRCAMCRREIPPEFLDHPQLVNGIDDICSTKTTDDGYQWFYEGRNGWWQYDDRTSQDIEEAFKKGEKSCSILVAGYVYIVDLESMLQQRQNEPARCRRVKRDLATIPKKGVAGLRIEGNIVTTDANYASQHHRGQQQIELSRPSISASEFISTIAATDAAIRIASDIIGSTLAHADDLLASSGSSTGENSSNVRSTSLVGTNTTSNPSSTTLSPSSSSSHAAAASEMVRGSRVLLGAAEDLLDATQNIISEADQQTVDLIEQTLNDFRALNMRTHSNSNNRAANNDGDNVTVEAEEEVDGTGQGNDERTNRSRQYRF